MAEQNKAKTAEEIVKSKISPYASVRNIVPVHKAVEACEEYSDQNTSELKAEIERLRKYNLELEDFIRMEKRAYDELNTSFTKIQYQILTSKGAAEQIVLPTNKEIKKKFSTKDGHYIDEDKIAGAKWMRDYIKN